MEAFLHTALLIFIKILLFAACLLIAAFIICLLFDIVTKLYDFFTETLTPLCKKYKEDLDKFLKLSVDDMKWKIKTEIEYYWQTNKEFIILLLSIGAPIILVVTFLYCKAVKYLF